MTSDPLCDCTDEQVRRIYAAALPQDRPRLLDRLEACVKQRRARAPLPALARDIIGAEYIRRAHTDKLMAALQRAVERADQGLDTKLIISMPPGSGKSMNASVVFPTWILLNRPDWEIGIISAEASLAEKFSGDIRDAYDELGAIPSKGGVTAWTLDGRKGGVLARGIKGGVSGRRLRVAIVDDPFKHMDDAYSEKIRETVWKTYRSVVKTRMRPGSIILSIATRWHDDDLNGRLLKQDGWEHLVFPAFAEKDDALGRAPGEPLLSVMQQETPDQATARWEKIREEVGAAIFNALYQQHPGELDGTVFTLGWWKYYDPTTLPPADQIITAWDLSFGTGGEDSGDWCVGQAWQRTGNQYYLLDQIRFRGGFTVQLAKMKKFIARYPTAIAHVVEQAANGAAAIETLQTTLDGVVPVKPDGSKIVRAMAVSPLVEAAQVHLPAGRTWVDDLVFETTAFPTGKHDDQVDALVYGLRRLRGSDVGEISVGGLELPQLPL